MKRFFAFLIPACVFTLPVTSNAQGSGLETGNVDVVRQFNARLADAGRFELNPKLPPLDTTRKVQTYNIINRPLNVQYPAPKIVPKTLQNEPQTPTYKGYARLGAGLPKAVLLEGGYDLSSKENMNLGFDLRHFSMNNTGKVENQRFAEDDLGVYAGFHSDAGFSIGGKVNYSRDLLYFYGYNDLNNDSTSALSYNSEDVKQRYGILSGQVKVYNNQRTAGDIDYSATVDVYTMEDLYASRENGLNLQLQGTKWFNEKHPLTLLFQTDFSTFRDTTKRSLNNFFLNPSYTYHDNRFRLKAGLNIAASDDVFNLFPQLEASVNVVENFLTAFAGVEGGLQKNNFRNLTEYNPFLDRFPDIRNSQFYHYFGGVKGTYRGVQYRAQIGYKDVQNLALFLANGDSIPRFNVLYDSAGIFTLSAEFNTTLNNLELGARFSQHVYSLEREEKPWHLPSLSLAASAAYTGLIEKLTLKSELFLQNGVPVRAVDGTTQNLNALLDLNFSARYQLSENISAFVQANNVLNNRWQRWQHYPTFGLNALVGLSARF